MRTEVVVDNAHPHLLLHKTQIMANDLL